MVLDKENAQARDSRRLHDRRLQGLHEGRPQEPPAQPGHPQDRRRLQQADRDRPLLAHGAAQPRSRARNDYNLNIPRYIDSSEPEDIQDLHAHLHGGIPDRDLDALSRLLGRLPEPARELFKPNRPGYSDLAVDVAEVQQTILDSAGVPEVLADVRRPGR